MLSLVGLPRAVLQRSRADWPVVVAAWLLLVCATTLLTTGVVYGDAVANDGLHRALLAAPPASRSVLVSGDVFTDRIDPIDATIRSEMTRAFGRSGGETSKVVRSGSFADRAVDAANVRQLTVFESLDGIEGHATLAAGRWPVAGGSPLETTLSEGAARAFGVDVGGRLALVSRLDASRTVDAVVVGIWRADASDAFWAADALETSGSTAIGEFEMRGPLVLREVDVLGLGGARARFSVTWRGLPNLRGLHVDDVEALRTAIDALPAFLRGSLTPGENPRVTTTLPALLADAGRSVLVSRSGIILLTIQFAVLAGYAIVLVAGILLERRRNEIALLRSRGASSLHLLAMAGLEATILSAVAAAIAPWLALAAVIELSVLASGSGSGIASAADLGTSAFVVAALAGLACIVALTLPTVGAATSPAGARAAQGRQTRTTLVQRLGLDLAFVAVAGVALWQLRLYGAPITRNARGALGLDPLLVAAPAIGLVGGAVLAVRIVPRIAEGIERLFVNGSGLVAALSGRQLARRPLRYTRTALLLMLAAALGTLAAAHAATWTRSQADQAAYQTAADVRVVAADYSALPTWAAGPLYRSTPGVVAATPVIEAPLDLGRVIRSGRIVGLDPGARDVIATDATPAEAGERQRLLDLVAADRPTTAAVPLTGEPRRIAITVDAAFEADPEFGNGAIPPDDTNLDATVVLLDADGRLLRLAPRTGSIVGAGQRLVVDLVDPASAAATGAPDLRPSGPLRLAAVEIAIRAPENAAVFGEATIVKVETSDASSGDTGWHEVELSPRGPDWQWTVSGDQLVATYPPADDAPRTFTIPADHASFGFAGASPTVARLLAALPEEVVLPAVASQTLLDQTGASVGDTLTVGSLGLQLAVHIVGSTELFAPYDPASSFLVTDLATFDALRFQLTGRPAPAEGWLLAVDPARSGDVLAALRRPSSSTANVIGRAELAGKLSTDPVALGLIGILGLGSFAAIVFAAIGFLVSSTVTTSERLGEFALLRALGLSVGQLGLWLSIESVFLLVIGLVAGWLLGLLLAWLVLPFATLTQTGATPVPSPAVVIPWQAAIPIVVAVVVLFVLSTIPVRRQLRDVRLSGVLRTRDG